MSALAPALSLRSRWRGLLLGTAVGDALGLPAEGLSRRRVRRIYGDQWRHRLVFGRGMVSDDTEHTVFVCQSLLAHGAAADAFTRRLAWCLRVWILALPAGVGFATLRAISRLWFGFPPSRSGVFSAGNGPAMRAAPVGAFFADEPDHLDRILERSTRLTHTDPRALVGARAVGRAAAWSIGNARPPSEAEFVELLNNALPEAVTDDEWLALVRAMVDASCAASSVDAFAEDLGLIRGVTGYAYHTVPVALYAWRRHWGDFERSLTSVFECGGDTDTTGAIVGGLAGSVVGEEGIPSDWIGGVTDWPRGTRFLRELGDELARASAEPEPRAPVGYFWPGVLARNLAFLGIILGHGLRRLLPPY